MSHIPRNTPVEYMTKREFAAIQILQGLISSGAGAPITRAVELADELLDKLETTAVPYGGRREKS